ncbi:short-chain dehydrogenase/reductase SDR [Acidovorax delafieldii 2AN]|uniref:Short-chain dehydrogenase/reductase SDR n=1 Tax=Acidovorax delafieldii 2AN TaxID=573060 RepID=C5T162_ACIDE|nr:SDR family oxidoreductase [Acidovorax delafieldii]EER61806.1 short-chain dehydrogenase/reductase SDR [Acidovorax delafieldii 2AN]
MDLGIAGRRAIVIGGSQGLGYAVCERLAAEGAELLLFARDAARLTDACARLQRAHGVRADACAGDITRAEDIDRLAVQAAEKGGAQILVLNTPRPPSPMRDFLQENDDARWEQGYQQQLHGALLVLRKLTPLVAAGGCGRVVAITSASVKQPMPRHAISTIYRAGVQAALKHLAMEVAAQGVTVNAVAPATVITPTFSTFHNLEQRIQAVPLKRAGKPEELAATVAFLVSEYAGFITGETIQLDGGQTLALC